LAEVNIHPPFKIFGVGFIGDEAYRAAKSAGTIKCALGSTQQFNPLEVADNKSCIHRGVINVGRDGGYCVKSVIALVTTTHVQAADNNAVHNA